MNLFKKVALVLLFALQALFGLSCGGAALPQTSIPLPSNDPITISAPNAQGLVTVSASAASDIPNSAIVVIQVGAVTSHWDGFYKVYDTLIPSAYAQSTCTSTLPSCPDVDGDKKCQSQASEDGSFTLTVPASLNESISVKYLSETSGCSEANAYEKTVTAAVKTIPMNTVSVSPGSAGQYTYFLGTDQSNNVIIKQYDNTDGTDVEYSDTSITGNPKVMDVIGDQNGNDYMIFTTDAGTFIGDVADDGSIDLSRFITIKDGNDNVMTGLDFIFHETKTYDGAEDTCVSSSLFEAGDTTFTRFIFYGNDKLYVVEFEDGISDLDQSYLDVNNNWVPRVLNISLDAYTGGNVGVLDSILSIPFFTIRGDSLQTVMYVKSNSASEAIVLRRTNDYTDYCGSNLGFSVAGAEILKLGQSTGDIEVEDFFEDVTGTADDTSNVLVLDQGTQSLTIIDMLATTLSCSTNLIHLDGISSDLVASECTVDPDDAGNEIISDVSMFMMFGDGLVGGESSEVMMIGKGYSGYQFMGKASNGSFTSVYDNADENISVLNPVDTFYDSTNDKVIVIDDGVAGDGITFIQTFKLGTSPGASTSGGGFE